ncbi:uncharacterized protein LJ206_020397 [Theristicus caerulescens]
MAVEPRGDLVGGGSVTAPQLRGPGGCVAAAWQRGPRGLSPPHRPPWASSCQHPPADGYPTAADGPCPRPAPNSPRDFTCDSLNISCRNHHACNQPGTAGTTLLPITLGTKPPATPSGRLWTRFYCHKCFVQEQQYPPEGAVLSSEIVELRLRPLGAKDAFTAPRPHTWSASELLPALPKATGGDEAKRRGVRVIFKAGTHLERANGLEGIPVVSGNQEIIHSDGSASDRGTRRPQPGPRGPVILDPTYTEEEMSARREREEARERQRMKVNAVSHRQSLQQSVPAFHPDALSAGQCCLQDGAAGASVAPAPALPRPQRLLCAFCWCLGAPAPAYQPLALVPLPQAPALLHLIPSTFSWGRFL